VRELCFPHNRDGTPPGSQWNEKDECNQE
jgi:hypothetical protein